MMMFYTVLSKMMLWTLPFILPLISISYQVSWDIVDSKGFTTLSLYTNDLEYRTQFFKPEERPKKLFDKGVTVWNGKLKKRCTGYVINYKDGAPVLLKIFTKGSSATIIIKYFAKVDGEWESIERGEYRGRIEKICHFQCPENITLDIDSTNTSHFDVTETITGNLNTIRYTLVTGASVTKVVNGDFTIWQSSGVEECHKININHDYGPTKLVSLLIVNPFDIGRRVYLKVRGETITTVTRRYYLLWLHSRATKFFGDSVEHRESLSNIENIDDGSVTAQPRENDEREHRPLTLNIRDVDIKDFNIFKIGNRKRAHRKCIPKDGYISRVIDGCQDVWKAKQGEECYAAILVLKSRRLVRLTLFIRDVGGKETTMSFVHNVFFWRVQTKSSDKK